MIFSQTLDSGLLLLISVIFAHYIGIRRKTEKSWNWLLTAGIFLIFGGIPVLGGVEIAGVDLSIIASIFSLLGWIFALIGTLYVLYELQLSR